ncbi:MAG: hypothetical protein H8E49_14670 [Gammaproteobacteria bacterium]|nr:hypothetical protein [Gammaproteobacteria bacterium]
MSLYAVTAAHLRASPKSKKAIAADLGVSFRWLYYFENEEIGDPGVEITQRLYTYLTGKQLKLKLVAA